MKKILVSLLVMTIALKMNAQTTIEEYNYVTKGYKDQIEKGLDMKKGYKIWDLGFSNTQDRKTELKMLVRIKDTLNPVAAYMIIYQLGNSTKEYICVPHPRSDKEVMTAYWNTLYNGDPKVNATERLRLFTYLISQYGLRWDLK